MNLLFLGLKNNLLISILVVSVACGCTFSHVPFNHHTVMVHDKIKQDLESGRFSSAYEKTTHLKISSGDKSYLFAIICYLWQEQLIGSEKHHLVKIGAEHLEESLKVNNVYGLSLKSYCLNYGKFGYVKDENEAEIYWRKYQILFSNSKHELHPLMIIGK
jgi:hypothetical protein